MPIPSPTLTKGTLLIVDDVADDLRFLDQMLSTQGYTVRSVSSGKLAMQSVLAKPPDLILLGNLMPEMDGYEVCQYLKAQEHTRHIPIIFVSAPSETIDKAKVFSLGGSDYLTKPVEMTEAIARIEHHLNISRLQQQLWERNQQLAQKVQRRKEAEVSLQRAMREVTDIKFALDQSAIVAITNAQGEITDASDQFCAISKFSRQELLGQTHRILNSGYHPSEFFRQMWDTISAGQVWKGEIRNRAKDGTLYWVEAVIAPMLDASGKPHQYVAICKENRDRGAGTTDKLRAALATWERFKAEEKVRLLQAAVVNANDSVVITTAGPFDEPGPEILYVNEVFTQLTGYTSAEVVGKTPRILQGPKTSAAMRASMREAFQAWQPFRGELLNYAKDGSEFWVDLSITPLHNESGKVTHWIAIQRDISDRRQQEAELQQINAALSHTVEGIARLNTQGQFCRVNHAYARTIGCDPEDIIGMDWLQTLYPDDYDQFQCAYETARQTGKAEVEARGVRKDGSTFHQKSTLVAIYDSQHQWTGHYCFIKDISDRVQYEAEREAAEAEIRQSEQIFRAIFDSMFQLTGILTPDGTVMEMNQTALTGIAAQRADVIDKPFWETPWWTHSPQLQDQLKAAIKRARAGELVKFETEHRWAGGTTVFIDFSLKPIYNDVGDVVMLISEGRDISQHKLAEIETLKSLEKERELNELKTRFISMVSHEYRTPLATILSSIDILDHYGHRTTEAEKQDYYQQIRVAIQRITDLMNDVLTLNKSELGKITCEPSPLNLQEFLQEFIAEQKRNLKTDHKIQLTIHEECLQAQMDKKLLYLIFSNLVSNAIKYSSPSGTINFDVHCQNQVVEFCVQDQGIGIPSEAIRSLFQPFFRAKNVGNISGTGLGLSIVKRLVEAHAGSISVKSQVGSGTTFTVKIPLLT